MGMSEVNGYEVLVGESGYIACHSGIGGRLNRSDGSENQSA
jgi:hypothetical protein